VIPSSFRLTFIPSSLSLFFPSLPLPYFPPNNTLFIELGQIFYKMLIEEYGSDHVFNCDTYNEMNPRNSSLTYLAATNKAIYETMRLVDEDAVFLMQGWLFHSGICTYVQPYNMHCALFYLVCWITNMQ